jgi:hypothetical protein
MITVTQHLRGSVRNFHHAKARCGGKLKQKQPSFNESTCSVPTVPDAVRHHCNPKAPSSPLHLHLSVTDGRGGGGVWEKRNVCVGRERSRILSFNGCNSSARMGFRSPLASLDEFRHAGHLPSLQKGRKASECAPRKFTSSLWPRLAPRGNMAKGGRTLKAAFLFQKAAFETRNVPGT